MAELSEDFYKKAYEVKCRDVVRLTEELAASKERFALKLFEEIEKRSSITDKLLTLQEKYLKLLDEKESR